ncbi:MULTISPECIES: hypothetical protein [unclassified Nonomuraea]|uniref:hypothetical protein n=1 Tax=unclassified Nonomuraea TaxID=2593643 RepID=UPI0033D79473
MLDRACTWLAEATGSDDFDDDAIPVPLRATAADPGQAAERIARPCTASCPPRTPTAHPARLSWSGHGTRPWALVNARRHVLAHVLPPHRLWRETRQGHSVVTDMW